MLPDVMTGLKGPAPFVFRFNCLHDKSVIYCAMTLPSGKFRLALRRDAAPSGPLRSQAVLVEAERLKVSES